MSQRPANRPRLFASVILSGFVALLGLLLLESALGTRLVHASYDTLHSLDSLRQPPFDDSRVVIVYLDLQSYLDAHQDPVHPWPRELHASLTQRLTAAGARAVVFDIVFGGKGPSAKADAALADSIRENGHVTLAAEFNNKASRETSNDDAWLRLFKLDPPYEPFAQAAAAWGIASQRIDDDFVVRRQLAGYTSDLNPTLVWVTAQQLQLPVTLTINTAKSPRWMRYYGPPLTLPHVSYVHAIDPTGVPDGFFRDKIVFVGARPVTGLFQGRQDEFRSPFHSFQNLELFMPGVEVHATELLNLLRGDSLRRWSNGVEAGVLLLVAILFGGGLLLLRPVPATFAAVAGFGLATGAAWFGFSRGVWFPWLIVAAVQIPGALFGSWLYQFQNWFFTRRRMEAAKKIADAKIREQAALIDKAHDAILVQELGGNIAYANPSAEKLYGWSLVELQREGALAELFSPDNEGATRARMAALTDGEWNGELRQQTRAGQVVTVASRWTLIRDDAGRPSALLLMNSDITEQKVLEQQFLRTQRMNTIGTLAGGMAHDLNNALAPILMGAQLLKRKASDAETREMLDMMEASTQRGADMVRQVLLFARGRGGEFDRLELGALVKEMEKMVRETFAKNISVTAFLPADLWPVRGNLTQLHQVLLNLCVNARDAMPEGGRLAFVADNVELSGSELAQLTANTPDPKPRIPDPRFVSLAVSDTGTGMPPAVRAKIFEPFYTTKGEGKGTGLGLATVLRIVKAHGGFLRVESEPGEGTTFEVFLPRAEVAGPAEAITPDAELPRGNGGLILIADDEQAIRELMTAELTASGYRVVVAANGAEAVTLFKQHAAEVKLFITDNSMPVMDGLQAIGELRKLRATLPVIVTSGETMAGLPENTSLLNKPFTMEELLRTVAARAAHT